MSKNLSLDYSDKANWCKTPPITKEVDTFYVYATEYIMGSMEEGAPDYADMDNAEMLEGAEGEYLLHATAYALFYNNIKDNVAKRIAAYKANR